MTLNRHKTATPIRDLPKYVHLFHQIVGARMYFVLVLGIFAAVSEGFGIVMLIPLLGMLDGSGAVEPSEEASWLQLGLTDGVGLGSSLLLTITIIAGVFWLKALFLFVAQGYSSYLQIVTMQRLRARLYERYMRMRLEYYLSRNTGHFINLLNNQIEGLVQGFGWMIDLAKTFVMSLVYLVIAFIIAWEFGLMAAVIGLFMFFVFHGFSVYVRRLSRKMAAEEGVLDKLMIQSVQSFKYLSSTAQGEGLSQKTISSLQRIFGLLLRTALAKHFVNVVREPMIIFFVLIIVGAQILWFERPVAPIVVSLLLFYRGLNSLLSLQAMWQSVLAKAGAIEMVRDEFATLDEQVEHDGTVEIGPLKSGVELKNVRFAYDEKQGDVLAGVSLKIAAFTSVALVGKSGSGKSTLVDLITLMQRPQEGRVLIDGVPSEKIRLSSWRKQIGFVTQDTVVFDDTIANNICLWMGEIDENPGLFDRVRDAAEQACIAEVIEALPDGYHTVVGDRGFRLSGGQRQRLFLARELFKRPSLLILDEATSALDSESEQAIQRSIDALKGQTTIVMIAHRLSTIRNVDRVFVIDSGRVAEEGEYDTLSGNEESRFSRLIALQQL